MNKCKCQSSMKYKSTVVYREVMAMLEYDLKCNQDRRKAGLTEDIYFCKSCGSQHRLPKRAERERLA